MKKILLFLVFLAFSTNSPFLLADDPGFYVRADAGLSINKGRNVTSIDEKNYLQFKHRKSPFADVGFGYYVTPHIRTDITYSLTSHKLHKHYSTLFTNDILDQHTQNTSYTGKIKSQTIMLNGYFDFASYQRFTPYITGGVGVALNRAKNFQSINIYTPLGVFPSHRSSDTYEDKTKKSFAWKLGAGSSVVITDNVKLDFGYHYINFGKAQTSYIGQEITTYKGLSPDYLAAYPEFHPKFKRLHSHQITGGLRYSF